MGRDFGSPVATMRDYLDRMGAPTQLPAPDSAYPRIIGANGPKMLALAGEITDGALPAMQPPEFTDQARQALGPDKLLVIFTHATIEQGDASAIMATVREHLAAARTTYCSASRSAPTSPPAWTAWSSGPGAGRAGLISASGARTGPAGRLVPGNSRYRRGSPGPQVLAGVGWSHSLLIWTRFRHSQMPRAACCGSGWLRGEPGCRGWPGLPARCPWLPPHYSLRPGCRRAGSVTGRSHRRH